MCGWFWSLTRLLCLRWWCWSCSPISLAAFTASPELQNAHVLCAVLVRTYIDGTEAGVPIGAISCLSPGLVPYCYKVVPFPLGDCFGLIKSGFAAVWGCVHIWLRSWSSVHFCPDLYAECFRLYCVWYRWFFTLILALFLPFTWWTWDKLVWQYRNY